MADMNQLLDDFCVYLELNEGRSVQTVIKYRRYLEALGTYLDDKGLTLKRADQTELEMFTGLFMHERGLRPRTRGPVVAAVRKFFVWLERTGYLSSNPAAGVPYPRAGKPLPIPMDIHYAEKLLMEPGLETFLGKRDTAILSLFIGCGLRASGLIALNQSNLMFLPDDDNKARERLALRVTEKGGRERIVPAPDECWALLRAYLGSVELDAIDRSLEDGDQVLFVSVNNRVVRADQYHGEKRRIQARSVDDMIKKYGERAGIPREQLHAHAMRHTFGTELAEEGIDLLERQALMGHASPASTQIYTHLAQRKLREAVDRGNPFRRIRTPVTELVRELQKGQ